jgi:predicted chitinase
VQPETELKIPVPTSSAARAHARRALVMARRLRPYAVLDGFAFDRVDVPPRHFGTIEKVARLALASQGGPRPIRAILLVGHTDPSGRIAYNFRLGRNRAEAVRVQLALALDRLRPGSSSAVLIDSRDSAGPIWPVASNASDVGRARNRRVEIFLSSAPIDRPAILTRTTHPLGEGEFEYVPSPQRTAFETSLRASNWQDAFLNLNTLNMFEMLRAVAAADPSQFENLWIRRSGFETQVNLPRIHYARNVVLNKVLPPIPVGDLRLTGQIADAATFLAEQFVTIARAANPDPLPSISLLLQECNFYDIVDKSHIAYVLASAFHESRMGRLMTELASGAAYEGRADLCNVQPGDGPRFKGRGFVQITGRCNYTFYNTFLLTRGLTVDLLANPASAADPVNAAIITAHGMRAGRFTGRRLSQFGSDCNYDFVRARAIVGASVVNGRNVAEPIAAVARRFRAAMN